VNRRVIGLCVLAGAIAVAGISPGCASTNIRELSGDEFLGKAQGIEQVSSFQWTSYVGVSGDRAYLECGYPAFLGTGIRTTVYWTRLSGLPVDTSQRLRAGDPPWKPWGAAGADQMDLNQNHGASESKR
jgi:hypothetical protein